MMLAAGCECVLCVVNSTPGNDERRFQVPHGYPRYPERHAVCWVSVLDRACVRTPGMPGRSPLPAHAARPGLAGVKSIPSAWPLQENRKQSRDGMGICFQQ